MLRRVTLSVILAAILAFALACGSADPDGDASAPASAAAVADDTGPPYILTQVPAPTIEVTSQTLDDKGYLDQSNTCEGEDTSPHLSWSAPPEGTKSVVIVAEDPQHQKTEDTWTHWIVYGLNPSVTSIEAGVATEATLPVSGVHGANDWQAQRYNGPCPTPTIVYANSGAKFFPPDVAKARPYNFYVYAIDIDTNLEPGAGRNTILKTIDGHVIAAGNLEAIFRSRKRETVFYGGNQ